MRTRPAFGRCDCAGSDRGWEVAGGYTSEASHVRRSPTPDGNSLLGGVAQLCHAFFHCSPTPELSSHPDELCLRVACDPAGRKCETKGVVVVAALRDRAGDLRFLSRYSNCPLSSHAEEYVVRDEELVRAVKEMAPEDDARSSKTPGSAGTLTLYQRLQPCHGSSDNRGPLWSCSDALVAGLHRELLGPRGVSLRVAVSYTYRAHWDVRGFESERERRWWGPKVEAAREGIRVFAAAAEDGVTLEALNAEDWAFLVSLCDEDVTRDYAAAFGEGEGSRGCGAFTAPAVAHRRAMDAFVAAEIRRHSASGPAANGPATNASIAGVAGERTERAARAGADTDEGDEPRTFAEKMRLKRRLAAANK